MYRNSATRLFDTNLIVTHSFATIVACTTREEIHCLQEKYICLVKKMEKMTMEKPPELLEFQYKTLCLGSPKEKSSSYIRDCLPQVYDAKTIPDIFGCLDIDWDYLNYGMLQHITDAFGDDEMKASLEGYIGDVETFQEKTTLAMLWETNLLNQGYSDAPLRGGLNKVIIKTQKFTPDSFLKSVDMFRHEFAHAISLPDISVIVKGVLPGCVLILFVPAKGVTLLKQPVQEDIKDFFRKNSIHELQVDDDVVYSSGE